MLLTGASGFIGSNLLPLLAKNHKVKAICRMRPSHVIPGVEYCELDLLQDDLNGIGSLDCDTLVHLAWGLPHNNYWKDPANLLWLQRSIAMTKIFLANGGKHVHIAGTCAEYDWNGEMPLRENSSRIKPLELYGKCKNALRVACARLCSQNRATLGWYRIFWPYGTGQDKQKFIPALAHLLQAGHEATCHAANLERDYIHVKDAAQLIANAIEQNFSGILNVGSGEAISLGDIAVKIASLLHKRELLSLGRQAFSRENPPMVVADTNMQEHIKDYRPLHDIDRGLADIINYSFC